ncbi:MAG: hypothetical protein N0C90_21625 [Candidatus Thiodiazotropha endolucinida]|nr:hypothetical protein [Candidatus Thiodiazotropha taylori]MCW4263956.1 hypothetical protein [Candidatus Thiodiazotropha endolucinida]
MPGNIETVVLLQIYYWEQLHDRTRFCNVTWDNVKDLTIQFQMHEDGISLQDGDLDCLSQLQAIDFQHLGSVYPVFFLTNETFSGLTNVATIQLSGWGIYMQNLRAMFSVRTSLQQLTHLNISNSTDPLVLDQDFIDDLSLRPLELLDISFRDITFDFSHARGLCKTLTTLLMLGSSSKLVKFPELCESLKFIDISRTHDLEKWLQRVPCGKSGYQAADLLGPLGFGLFRAVTTVHANGLITSTEGMRISSCKLVLEHSVTELHFSQNIIPEWEFIFWSTWPNQSHTGLRHIEIIIIIIIFIFLQF